METVEVRRTEVLALLTGGEAHLKKRNRWICDRLTAVSPTGNTQACALGALYVANPNLRQVPKRDENGFKYIGFESKEEPLCQLGNLNFKDMRTINTAEAYLDRAAKEHFSINSIVVLNDGDGSDEMMDLKVRKAAVMKCYSKAISACKQDILAGVK